MATTLKTTHFGKLFLIILAITFHFDGIHGSSYAYRAGYVYQYDYEGQILTSVDTRSHHVSGIRLKAKFSLQFQHNHYVVMQLRDIELYSTNGKAEFAPLDTQFIPSTDPISGDQADYFREEITKPLVFRYVSGAINEVRSQHGDPHWSVNMKKGVASLFVVNMGHNDNSWYSGAFSPRRQSIQKAYNLKEKDTTGFCDTKYVVSRENETINKIHLTKTKDFDDCPVTDEHIQGIFGGFSQTGKQKIIERMSRSDYVISGTRNRFRIDEVFLKSDYILDSVNDNKPISRVMMKLDLKSEEPLVRPVNIDSSFVYCREGLQTILPKASLTRAETNLTSRATYPQYRNIVNSKLDTLMALTYPEHDDQILRKHLELHHILREVDADQLTQLMLAQLSNASDPFGPKKWRTLVNILPTLPSNDISAVAVNLIQSRYIRGKAANDFLLKMAVIAKPTVEAINNFRSLWFDQTYRTREDGFQTLNAVAILTNRLHMISPRPSNKDVVFTVGSILRMFQTLLRDGETEADKINVLKAISNLGASSSIDTIKRIIDNKENSVRLRSTAVLALRKLAHKAMNILLPVYLDKSEDLPVRRAALHVVMTTKPSFLTLQMIGYSIQDEPIRSLQTLAYSYFTNLAKKGNDETGNYAKQILEVIPYVEMNKIDSKQLQLYHNFAKLNLDISLSLESGFNEEFGFIDYLKTSLRCSFFGFDIPVFDFDIGLEEKTNNLRKLNGTIHYLLDVMSDTSRTSLDKFSQLSLIWRYIQKHLKLNFNGQLFNQDLWNEEIPLENSYDSVTTAINKIVDQLGSGMDIDSLHSLTLASNSLVIPTSLGVPLSINISAITVLTLQGKLKVTNLPLVQNLFTTSEVLSEINAEVDVTPRLSVLAIGHMGSDWRWFCTGAGFKSSLKVNLPVNFNIDIGYGFTFSSAVARENSPEVTMKHVPFTYIHYIPDTIDRLPYQVNVRPIFSPLPTQTTWARSVMGLSVKVNQTEGRKLTARVEPQGKEQGRADLYMDGNWTDDTFDKVKNEMNVRNNLWDVINRDLSSQHEGQGRYFLIRVGAGRQVDQLKYFCHVGWESKDVTQIGILVKEKSYMKITINPNSEMVTSEDGIVTNNVFSFTLASLIRNSTENSIVGKIIKPRAGNWEHELSKFSSELASKPWTWKTGVEISYDEISAETTWYINNIIKQISFQLYSDIEAVRLRKSGDKTVGLYIYLHPDYHKADLILKSLHEENYLKLDYVPEWLRNINRPLNVEEEAIFTSDLSGETCPDTCEVSLEYVCGSNGMTYVNLCHLQQMACESGKRIAVRHLGIC